MVTNKTVKKSTNKNLADGVIRTGVSLPIKDHKRLTQKLQQFKYSGDPISIDAAIKQAIAYWLNAGAPEVHTEPVKLGDFPTLTPEEQHVMRNFGKLLAASEEDLNPSMREVALTLRHHIMVILRDDLTRSSQSEAATESKKSSN